jgi:hypothetical protein
MNYQNPFINPFGYGQTMPGQYMQPAVQQPAQQDPQRQVDRVNGENGARAYAMGPYSSALLLDESGTLVWMVTTDGAGYKTVAPYDIMPHKTKAAPDYTDLESRVRKLEDMMNGGIRYGNSGDSSAVGQKQHDAERGED